MLTLPLRHSDCQYKNFALLRYVEILSPINTNDTINNTPMAKGGVKTESIGGNFWGKNLGLRI